MTNHVLAVITARGGSKGIPGKNIADLAGKPLIAWTIEAALRSKAVSRVIVSTDDAEIAAISRQWGAEVPFLRPALLASDTSPHLPVLLHALAWIDEHDSQRYDYILLLQPTSPLRATDDIEHAVQIARDRHADSVVSVYPAHPHPLLARRITDDGHLEEFAPRTEGYLARQGLPPAYMLNGAIYLVRREVLVDRQSFYTDRTFAYVMPQERSLDIDTPWDLYLANLILGARDRQEIDAH
ncbi:MAG: acylneuraminate cytidylyltransferase family protein [Chloroflexales bacterium]